MPWSGTWPDSPLCFAGTLLRGTPQETDRARKKGPGKPGPFPDHTLISGTDGREHTRPVALSKALLSHTVPSKFTGGQLGQPGTTHTHSRSGPQSGPLGGPA